MAGDGGRRGRPATTASAWRLVLACHPVPTVAVTCLAAVLISAAGDSWRSTLLGAIAVLAGQLSIGWSNDLIDARRDAAAGRSDKPIAAGTLSRHTVVIATGIALVATVVLSLLLGWRAGLAQLLVVAAGWAYNGGMKSTALSPVPYLVAFGVLPAVATLATARTMWPPWWAMTGGAMIGLAAHFGNALPDLADDHHTGVRGLPQLLGARTSAVAACLSALGAAVLIFVAALDSPSALHWWLVGLAGSCTAGALFVVRRKPTSEALFLSTVLVAAIAVMLMVSADANISAAPASQPAASLASPQAWGGDPVELSLDSTRRSDGDLNSNGSAALDIAVAQINGGQMSFTDRGRSGGDALRTPAYDPGQDSSRAVLKITNTTGEDDLNPGTSRFVFGADFTIDVKSSDPLSTDNGDNLVQRGLSTDSTQYKLQLDHHVVTCSFTGSGGVFSISSTVTIEPDRWYRARCHRYLRSVAVVVTSWSDDGNPTTDTRSKSGSPGDLTPAQASTPLSVGGKLKGQTLLNANDQFNGQIDNVILQILDD
ncbi:MAG: UbiA family prenyltransferase [Nocardioidaceae bacterium]